MTRNRGMVLALVGPVCAGKSLVSQTLRRCGAEVWNADAEVHKLYERDDVKQQVRAEFGDVFQPDGSVDRTKLARRVFGEGNDDARKRLTEKIIFPRTRKLLEARRSEFFNQPRPERILVLDAPTIFESGGVVLCDRVLLVTAPFGRRLEWARARNWPDDEIARRERVLIPEQLKRQQANYILENTGSINELEKRTTRLYQQMVQEWGEGVGPLE